MTADEDMREDHVQDRARPDAARRQWDAWLAEHDARIRTAAHSDLTVYSEAVTVESDEPTDAEVRAVKIALIQAEYRVVPGNELVMIRQMGREGEYDHRARAALAAAKGARA